MMLYKWAVSSWHRHLPGAKVIELESGQVQPCMCSLRRRRWMLFAQGILDAWRET